jgi:hypothetical protein
MSKDRIFETDFGKKKKKQTYFVAKKHPTLTFDIFEFH